MSRVYKKSPIVEAVCEFQFEELSDLAVLGLVYEKLRGTFPTRRQVERLTVNTNLVSNSPPEFVTTSLMQFIRKNEKALVQVGPQLVSVNVLAPYPSWQKFLPLIIRGVNAYQDVANPKSIRRIGLRYINRIEIPSQNLKLEDYFEFRPYLGINLPQDFGSFILGVQIPFENLRDVLDIQLVSLPKSSSSTDKASIILSLDYFLLKPQEVSMEQAFDWLGNAHNHIEDAFEACITEKLRSLFQEVQN